VRLPSGAEREGTVFDRGVDAGFATQRDVSRTRRDIKTFEIPPSPQKRFVTSTPNCRGLPSHEMPFGLMFSVR
jgi:hypothetical protein